jgi:SAM-dependent methyltransferase
MPSLGVEMGGRPSRMARDTLINSFAEPTPSPGGPMAGYKASYDARYAPPGLYWGARPTGLCRSVVQLRATLPRRSPTLLDLGTGEGRDLIHFARHGFRVVGIDISRVGLAKAACRAERLRLSVRVRYGDIRTCRLGSGFDVVFSSGAVNNLPKRIRARRFVAFKAATVPGGINAMNAFVLLRASPCKNPTVRNAELDDSTAVWGKRNPFRIDFKLPQAVL